MMWGVYDKDHMSVIYWEVDEQLWLFVWNFFNYLVHWHVCGESSLPETG